MAISYVGISSTAAVVSNANITLTEPSGVQQNDVLLAIISHRSTIGYQTPSGWAKLLDESSGNINTTCSLSLGSGELFWIVRGSSAPTLTFTKETGTGDVAMGRIIAFRGCDTTTPIRNSTSRTLATASTTVVTNTSLSHNNGDAVIGAWCGACDTTWSTERINGAPTSLTEVADSLTTSGADTSLAVAYTILTGDISSQTTQATAGSSGRHVVLVVTLQPPITFGISNVDDEDFLDKETGIKVEGGLFGATQGTSILVLADSATYSSATKLTQTKIRSWSAGAIYFDMDQGSFSDGTLYLYVVKDPGGGGEEISDAYSITVNEIGTTGWLAPSSVNEIYSGTNWTDLTVGNLASDDGSRAYTTVGNYDYYSADVFLGFSGWSAVPSTKVALTNFVAKAQIQITTTSSEAAAWVQGFLSVTSDYSSYTQVFDFGQFDAWSPSYVDDTQEQTLWSGNSTTEEGSGCPDLSTLKLSNIHYQIKLEKYLERAYNSDFNFTAYLDLFNVKVDWIPINFVYIKTVSPYGYIMDGDPIIISGGNFDDAQLDSKVFLISDDDSIWIEQTPTSWAWNEINFTANLSILKFRQHLKLVVIASYGKSYERRSNPFKLKIAQLTRLLSTTTYGLNDYTSASDANVWEYYTDSYTTLGNNTSTSNSWNWETAGTPTSGTGPTAPQEGGGYVYLEPSTYGSYGATMTNIVGWDVGAYDIYVSFYYNKRGTFDGSVHLFRVTPLVSWFDTGWPTYSAPDLSVWSSYDNDIPLNATDVWKKVNVKLNDMWAGHKADAISTVDWGFYCDSNYSAGDFAVDSIVVYVCAKSDAEVLSSGITTEHKLVASMTVDTLQVSM